MKKIIAREIEDLKIRIEKFFEKEAVDVDQAESYFTEEIARTVCQLLSTCYEAKDAELLADKATRRESGLAVERRGDKEWHKGWHKAF